MVQIRRLMRRKLLTNASVACVWGQQTQVVTPVAAAELIYKSPLQMLSKQFSDLVSSRIDEAAKSSSSQSPPDRPIHHLERVKKVEQIPMGCATARGHHLKLGRLSQIGSHHVSFGHAIPPPQSDPSPKRQQQRTNPPPQAIERKPGQLCLDRRAGKRRRSADGNQSAG